MLIRAKYRWRMIPHAFSSLLFPEVRKIFPLGRSPGSGSSYSPSLPGFPVDLTDFITITVGGTAAESNRFPFSSTWVLPNGMLFYTFQFIIT